MFNFLKNNKIEYHVEEVTQWNLVPGSYSKLEPSTRYEIVMEITTTYLLLFSFKKRIRFKDSAFYHYIKHYTSFPLSFSTEKKARDVIENLLLQGKRPGMITTRTLPPSYEFKDLN